MKTARKDLRSWYLIWPTSEIAHQLSLQAVRSYCLPMRSYLTVFDGVRSTSRDSEDIYHDELQIDALTR